MERGHSEITALHEFNDPGQWWQMIAHTGHPDAQVASCWCDSGKRFRDCHFAPYLDEPCTCGAGRGTFRECCSVDAA